MNILILNLMVYTIESGHTPILRRNTIKDTMIYNFIRGFVMNGHSVTLVGAEPLRPKNDEDYICKVEWFPLRFRSILPNGFMFPHGLLEYLRKNHSQFDLIISSDVFSVCSLFASMICPEKLLIWHEPGKYHNTFHQIPAKIWYNVIARLFIKKKVAVIARSQQAINFISQFVDHLSPEYIDHGINQDIFVFSDQKQPYFIIIARLIAWKRIDRILLKFANFLKKYKKNFHLYIAGDGPERESLEKITNQLRISEHVCFLGYLPHTELVNYLSHATGVLIDSYCEFSMVTIPEAIVCGTPVLTNTVPYPSSYVSSDHLGIVKDNWNEDDINELIVHQKEFTENCRKRRPKMSNQYLAKHMLELYTEIKNEHSAH